MVWVAATRNRHKLQELRRLLPGLELREPPPDADAVEDGATFLDNARIKARAVHAATGLPALADDSGIEVDALNCGPGVHSARFAGPEASDAENLALLLDRLRGVPDGERGARYRAVVVLIDGQSEIVAEGVLEGRIADEPRGTGGFGYDPAFVPEGESRTVGEMAAEEKDAISHRARACRVLWEKVRADRPD